MKRIASVFLVATFAAASPEAPMDAGTLAHALDRLAVTGRVLYVAAHPDDENTRLLAYLANHRHVTAAYLSMTRGGGGQNLIGREQAELLDVIRTEELLAARRLDGARQRFTRMRDFGYSKSAEETFATWGHDAALGDVVEVIRAFQPDVVITRFDEKPPNHGHHTASAILAREAFEAAADPKRFPEQLARGLAPWRVTRVLHNVPTWRDEPPPAGAMPLEVGLYDPRLGLSYGELAARSRSQHQSQGFGVPGERGSVTERFVPVAGTAPASDPLDGVPLGWDRYGAKGEPVQRALDRARGMLERDRPERCVPDLVAALAALDALPDEPRVRDARRGLGEAIASASGLFVRATAKRAGVVPGETLDVQVEVVMRREAGIALVDPAGPLAPYEKKILKREIAIAADAAVTAPPWSRDHEKPVLATTVEVEVGGRRIPLEAPIRYVWTDPVLGERVRDVLVVPPATVTPLREAFLAPNGKPAPVAVRVRAGRDGVRGTATIPAPPGWRVEPASIPVELAKAGDETTLRFSLTPPAGASPVEVNPSIEVDGRRWSFREDTIDHPHIPVQLVLQPARARVSPLAIAIPDGLVGYVPGSGDSVADDLAHLGVRVETIDEAALASADLARFRAIVVGIRAYNTSAAVRAAHPRLMKYVEDGGCVVVQYNTQSRVGPLEGRVGPYPLEIGRGRVTDERATMKPLVPDHDVLQTPNRITAADFDGWVQERGLYFAQTWDPSYVPVLAAADPGEEPLAGGLLVARHGKGRYVYTGLAFFRQLPAGVPGAYRLFVNLLGAGK
jgi:LmbE family N-acetylglucosaminyl deacetylase